MLGKMQKIWFMLLTLVNECDLYFPLPVVERWKKAEASGSRMVGRPAGIGNIKIETF
jgi:hypothetical protein